MILFYYLKEYKNENVQTEQTNIKNNAKRKQ